MNITITKTQSPKPLPDNATLGFGRIFTDHMFAMEYTSGAWRDPRIVPYGDISLPPAAAVFHYGAEVFEGLKAYRRKDGGVQLFRPLDNMHRLNDSAARLCLPQIDPDVGLEALKALVKLDAAWVPNAPGTSLYLRPVLPRTRICPCTGSGRPAFTSSLPNYKEGLAPVRIMIETQDVRAVRGGTGYAKCGGNYAAATRAGDRAEKLGFSQVLWLDGVERKYVEEVGSMNVMFKIEGRVVTPQLTGSVLPGITRRSCIQLLQDWGVPVEERLVSVEELLSAARDGRLEEAFGCGTAAVVSPIGELVFGQEQAVIHQRQIGPLTQRLYDVLTGIQYGTAPDPHGWAMRVI